MENGAHGVHGVLSLAPRVADKVQKQEREIVTIHSLMELVLHGVMA